MFKKVFFSLFTFFIYKTMWNFINLNSFKRQQMVKTNEQVSKDKLGTNKLNDVFLKIFLYPYDHISKFQELAEI